MAVKFEAVNHDGKFMGEKFTSKHFLVFFGSRHATWEDLPKLFPKFEFAKLKQTHGNGVLNSPTKELREADGHWTQTGNVALTIVTADCLPIMISDEARNKIAAVHAGWRGMENRVLLRTLDSGFSKEDLHVYIGPHIHRQNFEVGNDVSEKLIKSAKNLNLFEIDKSVYPHPDPQKKYVDLSHIAKAQLTSFGVKEENIYFSKHNTFTNNEYASYRRKDNPADRQISFIVLLK